MISNLVDDDAVEGRDPLNVRRALDWGEDPKAKGV